MKLGLASKAHLVRRAATDEMVLVYPERALELNSSAAEIVELIDGTHSEPEIVTLLAERHPNAPRERIELGVSRVLLELESRALLRFLP